MELETIHYPNLKTVMMVEDALKSGNLPVRREELKKRLPKQVMHQTLNIILAYLEESGKILDGRNGIVWIHNTNPQLEKAIRNGVAWSSRSAHKRKTPAKTSHNPSRKR